MSFVFMRRLKEVEHLTQVPKAGVMDRGFVTQTQATHQCHILTVNPACLMLGVPESTFVGQICRKGNVRLQLLKHVPRPLADLYSRTTYHEELFPSPRVPVNIPLPFAEVIFWLTTSPYWSNYQGVVCREIKMGCKQDGERKGGEGGGQGGVKEEERWGKCICVEFGY